MKEHHTIMEDHHIIRKDHHYYLFGQLQTVYSPIFTEVSTRFAQNDQPVTHRGVNDKLYDLFRA